MNFIVYQPDGVGCFIEVGSFSDLASAVANCPSGCHVEEKTETGSVTVYTAP